MTIDTINMQISEFDSKLKKLKMQIEELEDERDRLSIEKYYIRHPDERVQKNGN